ncbi:MAG: PqqD family peptide modification chaperone [Actinomycetota bacterium]
MLDTKSSRVGAYNSSAQEVWELLERGARQHEIITALASSFGIPEKVASHDVNAIIEHWRSQGMLSSIEGGSPTNLAKVPTETEWARGPRRGWSATLTFTVRSIVFELAIEPPDLVDLPRIFFKHLESPFAAPGVHIEIRAVDDNEAALVIDGIERLRTVDRGQLIGALNQFILEHIHPGTSWLAIIHGAAVARSGFGVAFPAACGSGKTTLTAYLLTRGYDYLADDHVALSAPDGRIVPWPLPMSIKEGSWEVLSESYTDIWNFPQYQTTRGEARQLVPPPAVWNTDAVPLKGFVFPRYVPGAKVTLVPLTPFEALQRFLGDQIWLGWPITPQRLRDFLNWLSGKPAYLLQYGSAADAANSIADIV